MRTSLKYREILADARRVVVKIGSRVLVQKSGRPDTRRMRSLVREIADLHKADYEVALVSSGAIGAGMEALGMKQRPKALPDLQMAAAVGQTRLMSRYDRLFSDKDCKVGQVLLTHADFQHKMRLTNARRTLINLLRNNVIPIINENDVVADEEIKADLTLGDNDLLASLLVKLIRADLLIMLTTVDGFRQKTPSGRTARIKYLEAIDAKTLKQAGKSNSDLSTGGMLTKLRAAQTASTAGCAAIIANGLKPGILSQIMSGKDVGTLVVASAL